MEVTPIAEDTTTIRSLDWDRDRFDIEFGLQNGTTYNSFIVRGEKVALVDTSHAKFKELYLKTLTGEIDPKDYRLHRHQPYRAGSQRPGSGCAGTGSPRDGGRGKRWRSHSLKTWFTAPSSGKSSKTATSSTWATAMCWSSSTPPQPALARYHLHLRPQDWCAVHLRRFWDALLQRRHLRRRSGGHFPRLPLLLRVFDGSQRPLGALRHEAHGQAARGTDGGYRPRPPAALQRDGTDRALPYLEPGEGQGGNPGGGVLRVRLRV